MRLLLIEDDEALARNLKKFLELKGFAVDWIDNAEKARTRVMLYQKDYDLLLLDLTLAGMSGAELTKSIREEGVTIPIIITTGESGTQHKIELLNSGADDYVVKPFSTEELVARIRSVLRRPSASQPIIHEVGGYAVDTAARRVKSGDVEIPLTLKEYSLFECFVRRPGEVLTREELCNQVWDFNTVTWSNVLDVHMKNLRKKLSLGEGDARFETVRGIGYRLVV